MKNLIVGVLTGLVAMSCACKKREPYPEIVNMVPLVPVTITPVQKDYQLNDTLWLMADFSDSLTELYTQKKYRFPSPEFELKTSIGFLKLVDKSQGWAAAPGSPGSFAFVNQVGGITDIGGLSGVLRFVYENNRYKARVGIVLRSKGVFAFDFLTQNMSSPGGNQASSLDFIKLEDTPDGQRRRPNLEWVLYIVNEGDNNFDLLKEYSLTATENNANITLISKIYEQKGTFTIVVQ